MLDVFVFFPGGYKDPCKIHLEISEVSLRSMTSPRKHSEGTGEVASIQRAYDVLYWLGTTVCLVCKIKTNCVIYFRKGMPVKAYAHMM